MKKAVLFLGLVCVGLAGFCVWQARELATRKADLKRAALALDQEHRAQAEKDAAHAYLERREREWQEKAVQLSSVVATLRSSESAYASNYARLAQASGSTNTSSDAGTAPPEGSFGKGMQGMLAKMMNDPNMREFMRTQQSAMIKKIYGPLIRDLNLPAEQQAKLAELLLDQQMKTIERSQAAFQDGNVDLKKIAESGVDVQKEHDAAIKELIGEAKYAEFEEYKKTMGERMQLSQLQDQMKETGTPLQEEQTKRMLAVIKEERERNPPVFDQNAAGQGKDMEKMFADGVMERHLEWQEELNRRVAGRLGDILTPEQLKAYTEMQAQQLSMQKFGMKMAREMFGKSAPGSSPAAATEK